MYDRRSHGTSTDTPVSWVCWDQTLTHDWFQDFSQDSLILESVCISQDMLCLDRGPKLPRNSLVQNTTCKDYLLLLIPLKTYKHRSISNICNFTLTQWTLVQTGEASINLFNVDVGTKNVGTLSANVQSVIGTLRCWLKCWKFEV